jgi:putative ABC transport system permease protein
MFMSSIILGIAALVAINSFNYNLVKDVDKQAATLLGADLVVSGNRPATDGLLRALDSLPGDKSEELELFSMSYMPQKAASQVVRIKALSGDFPYYGKLNTIPESAGTVFKSEKSILVDEGMMLQYKLEVGDSLKLGQVVFPIAGKLLNSFGSQNMGSSFAPTVYMDKQYITETELVQPGSLIDYVYYRKVPESFDIDAWKAKRRRIFRSDALRMTTIEDRKEDLNEAFDALNYFLNLVALVSLLLGCIGVASSVFIYVKSKISSIATFRCLGMKGNQAFMIYFLQIIGLAVFGVLAGAILGSAIQMAIPKILSDFLPFTVVMSLSWKAIWEGIFIGLLITTLFALLPLIAVRNISPLRTLRASYDETENKRDPLKYFLYVSIIASLGLFLWRLTGDIQTTLGFTGGIVVGFLVLYLVSIIIIWSVRKFFPRSWNYVFRQGLSNLFRPNNQTQTLLISIGLGTAVLSSLFIIQGLLLNNVDQMDAGNQPNMIMFGIEPHQTDDLIKLTKKYDLPVLDNVPIVTMRLEAWKGRAKKDWLADTSSVGRRRYWPANREARVTFRDTLDGSEVLLRGQFYRPVLNPQDSIFISVDDGWAEGLGVDIGDELVFNVQGTRITTYIGSIRDIEFRSMSTRFFVVFPSGVLEEAPQFRVLVSKSPDKQVTADYRNDIVKAFPNVSVIDLGNILETVSGILDKVSYIIKFMAGFSILTGLIVLISSLLLSKYQRIKESVLLRTIGASRKQILQINATEYFILGALSAFTGIIISIVGSFLLAKYQLDLSYDIKLLPIVFIFFIVTGLTVLIGMINSREVVSKSPLEVLRKEVG